MNNTLKSDRIEVVDALRGVALFAIVILHCFEHYNLYYMPDCQPHWLTALDKGVWDTVWFLFGGKAFSTFSFLFGLSFFIQFDNAKKHGLPFRWRFVWRMILLMLFSQLHSLFYNGDILLLYSIMGIFLVSVSGLSTKSVLILASVMIIQPVEWIRLICIGCDIPFLEYGNNWVVYGNLAKMESGSLLEILKSNITDGQLYGNVWQIENGRLFQIPGLFMLGMLLGRMRFFVKSECSVRFWRRSLVGFLILFAVILAGKAWLAPVVSSASGSFQVAYGVAVGTYQSFCLMAVLVSVFVLCWFRVERGYRFQRALIPYGKMSLTNYITQSIIGCTVYYGYGLGLWNKTGATLCLLIGLVIFFAQLSFSRYWLARHKQGPLEYLWKRLTWIKLGSK